MLPSTSIPSNGGGDDGESDGLTVIVTLSGSLAIPFSLGTTSIKAIVSCASVSGAVNA